MAPLHQSRHEIAGLRTLRVAPPAPSGLVVVLLHGYAMRPEDLAPFACSLGVAAEYLIPEGPLEAVPGGRAWWSVDETLRVRALSAGPRDLAAEDPAGAPNARRRLQSFVDAAIAPHQALAIVGFSQGGMLAGDAVLRGELSVSALALLSSSRIAVREWDAASGRLRGLPMLVAHGRRDDDLSFAAGEALRDFARRAGAAVTWVPHEEGHQIPLVVWRQLKHFLRQLPGATPPRSPT